jgi:SpoVK/Ycf46/Vps4 family AAA+-type ATPase
MIHSHLSLVTTDLSWNDLILEKETFKQVEEIKNWLKHSSSIDPEKKLKPGYRSLFYGSASTEKVLTVTLIGNECDKPVYKLIFQSWCQNILAKPRRT